MNESHVFLNALKHTPAERAAYLDEACAGDAQLRADVEALLRAHDTTPGFLEHPIAGFDTTREHCSSTDQVTGSDPFASVGQPGAVFAGRYKLVEPIGEGGMGSVWSAQQTEPVKRPVAVKLIKRGMDSGAVLARFEAERQALALMDHPNIARVLDAGTAPDGRPFFVMELVTGDPITRYCDEHKLTVRGRLDLFVSVCRAAQHAHQKGVIHRDIKPSNVLVASCDGQPMPKVIDFGVAKATGEPLTEESMHTGLGTVIGTPEYMSPEQAGLNPLDVDTRSDVYSLGAILYELLAGRPPLPPEGAGRPGLFEILRSVREDEPVKPSTRLSTADGLQALAACRGTEPERLPRLVRGELDWIVMKALEKDRNRRYGMASELASDIERFLADETVSAGPPTAAYRLRKFVSRNKASVATVVLVVAALAVGVGGLTLGLVEARRQRDAADAAWRAEAERAEREEQATAAERVALKQARSRLAQIEKGVVLLASLLTGIRPQQEAPGAPPLYQQLLARAAKAADELDEELVGDPLVVARLQTILGGTLINLGDAPKGIAVLEKARLTRERLLGVGNADTLVTQHDLALGYLNVGRWDEAIGLYERISETLEARRGTDHPETLGALSNLASTYRDAGRTSDSVRLFKRVYDARVATAGANHPAALAALSNLASSYLDSNESDRRDEAIKQLERVRDAQLVTPGADHADTLITLYNLARAYQSVGRLTEAIRLYEQVRDVRTAKFGASNPTTLVTQSNLATAYYEAGRLPEAIALLERVYDAQVAMHTIAHPRTLTTLSNLAAAYHATGRVTDAIPLYERARDAQVTVKGAYHPDTINTMANLAQAYREAGRLPEALPLFEQVVAGLEKRHYLHPWVAKHITSAAFAYEEAGQHEKAETWWRKWMAFVTEKAGAGSIARASALAALGQNLLGQKRWTDAEATLRECLVIYEKSEPGGWATAHANTLLGRALLGQRRYAEAETLLDSGCKGMTWLAGMSSPQQRARLADAIDRLIEVCTAMNKPDEVERWRAERRKYPDRAPLPRPVK